MKHLILLFCLSLLFTSCVINECEHQQTDSQSPYKVSEEVADERQEIEVTKEDQTISVYPEFSFESDRKWIAYIFIDPVTKKRFLINTDGHMLEIKTNVSETNDTSDYY